MMYVSAYVHPRWFESDDDEDLRFLKQIGVDHLDVRLDLVKGYSETGLLKMDDLMALVDRLDNLGLKIERVVACGTSQPAEPGTRLDLQEETDKLCQVTEMVGRAGIAVMEPASPLSLRANIQGSALQTYHFQGMYAGLLIDAKMPGWEERAGRGGYVHPAFDYQAALAASPGPPPDEAEEEVWEDLVTMYRQLIPVAESAGVLVSQHGADPPVPSLGGRAQILYRFADFDRLFSEVPSPNNGMTFCVGTRYESGEDIFEGIRHFGGQGKIVHVHFRNVRGTLPKDRGYEERLVDDGDVDMMKVVRTLDEVGYDRALDYDHVVRTAGDSFIGRQSAAFAAGYIKGLLAGVA